MFHGTSERTNWLQTLHFSTYGSILLVLIVPINFCPNKLRSLEFMDDTGSPSEFPQAKAQQKFTVESVFLQLQLYMILRCHTINDASYSMGSNRRKPAMNGLGLQLYKKKDFIPWALYDDSVIRSKYGAIPAAHCSIFMEPVEHGRIMCKMNGLPDI